MLEIPSDPNNRLDAYFRSLDAAKKGRKKHKPKEDRRNFLRTVTVAAISGAATSLGFVFAGNSLANVRTRWDLDSLKQKLDGDYKNDFSRKFTKLAKETPNFLDLICYMKLLQNPDDEKRTKQLSKNIKKNNRVNNDPIKFNAVVEGVHFIRQLFLNNDIDLEGIKHFYKTSFLGQFRNYYRNLKDTSSLCKEIVEKVKNYNELAKLLGEQNYKSWISEDSLVCLKEELRLTSDSLSHYDSVAEECLNAIWKLDK